MKYLLILLGLVATVLSVPVREVEEGLHRHYDPREEDPHRIRYILTQDVDGHYQIVDLFKEDPTAERANINDLTLYLYTRNTQNDPATIPANNFSALANSNFNPSRQNVFIAHGWNNNRDSGVFRYIRPAILARHDVNLFVVDWSRPANLFYTSARNAVPIMGDHLGDFINTMMSTYNIGTDRFNLIGYSLGAHLVGCAGARVNGLVNSIVGLDPAGPLYTVRNRDNRIDDTDGNFVQIIHTNSGLLGFSSSIGHTDYYPNGGRSQPGCGIDLTGSCAHSRSYKYYAESILTSGFISRHCSSLRDYNRGRCDSNHSSWMGDHNVDQSAYGDHYLVTASSSPFAMG